MPASPMTFVLANIYNQIPHEILNAAFEPTKNKSTLDELIIDEVIATRVLMDLNLVSGLRARIPLSDDWKIPVQSLPFEIIAGSTYDADYYQVPSKNRQGRNIVAIEQIADDYSFTSPTNVLTGGMGGEAGNTIGGLAQVAIASRTQQNQPIMPAATLMSNNLVKVYPSTYSAGLILECTLEFDRELTNMNQNMIIPTRNLSLCATKAYIYNKLRIKIDSSEVVAGMQLGSVKEIVLSYEGENAQYEELLMKVRGSSIVSSDNLAAFAQLMV